MRPLRTPPPIERLTRLGWPASFPIVQFPNPPLIVALLASAAGHFTHGTGRRAALSVFYVALSAWAYEETRHGANWFRRSLGFGFLVYIVVNLVHALRA